MPDLFTTNHSHKVTVDLTDEDVLAIAQAWPRLRVFKIPTTATFDPDRKAKITFAGLGLFSRYCMLLEELRVSVDASTSQSRPDSSQGLYVRRVRLDVSTPGPREDVMAASICAMWPNLEGGNVSFARYGDHPAGESWRRVWDIVKTGKQEFRILPEEA